jgi:ribonuclease Z
MVVLIALSATLGCNNVISRIAKAAADRQASAEGQAMLEDDAMNVFLCGTGSPLPDPKSASSCTMVIAGGKTYVVDVGLGSQEVAQLAGIPSAAIGGIFLTHFHSDHIGELGEWAVQSWINGRSGPLHVYGPEGVDQVVSGFKQAYRPDDTYRIAHHGLENLPIESTEWISHTVPYANGPATPIFDEGGLVISVFAVDHKPVEPAVGYRFDYKGRSVVVSGDTDQSNNLEANAKGADLLIHEVLLKDVISMVSDSLGESGRKRLQTLAMDITDYHTSPSEASESANKAGVDTLVFTHLVPTVPGPIRKWLFMRGVDAGDVDVILGEDGMVFRLPPDSDAIERN